MYRCCNKCGAFDIDDSHVCMTTPKPREWWIDERPDVNWDAAFRKKWGGLKFVHVIEYSAYEQAKSDDAKTQAALDHVLKLNEEALAEIETLNGSITRASLAHAEKDREIERLKEYPPVFDGLRVSSQERSDFEFAKQQSKAVVVYAEKLARENSIRAFDCEKLLTECETALEACMQDTHFYAAQTCDPLSQGAIEGWDRMKQANDILAKLKQMRGGE